MRSGIEISDAGGKLVRGFTSEVMSKDTTEDGEADMATGFLAQGFSPGLKKSKGMHRFRWDLRHFGAWDEENQRRAGNGPRVSPGEYTIKLITKDDTYTETLEVKADPRILQHGISLADLRAQESLALKVRDLMGEADKLNTQIKTYTEKESNPALEEIEQALNTAEGRYMTPKLIAQLQYLYYMLIRSDQKPGQDAYERHDELNTKLQQLKSKAESIGI